MPTKIGEPVRIAETGEVTTIDLLTAAGRIRFTVSNNFRKRGGGTRVAYFAELIPEMNNGTEGCWEISAAAYAARTGADVSAVFEAKPQKPATESGRVALDTGTPWLAHGRKFPR